MHGYVYRIVGFAVVVFMLAALWLSYASFALLGAVCVFIAQAHKAAFY